MKAIIFAAASILVSHAHATNSLVCHSDYYKDPNVVAFQATIISSTELGNISGKDSNLGAGGELEPNTTATFEPDYHPRKYIGYRLYSWGCNDAVVLDQDPSLLAPGASVKGTILAVWNERLGHSKAELDCTVTE